MPISTKAPFSSSDIQCLAALACEFLLAQGKSHLNGVIKTPVDGVRLFRDPTGCKKQPLLYQSGIIIMLKGSKRLYIDSREIVYKKGDYLVLGVPLPAECAAFTGDDDCILGLVVDVPPSLLVELTQLTPREASSARPTFTVSQQSLDTTIADATRRLLAAFTNKNKALALGASYVREIIYHVLNGPAGYVLSGLTENGHYARVAKALHIIHEKYATSLNVEQIARDVNMSPSGFHRVFREVVLDTPIQYIKKVRLAKARERINGGERVSEAAEAVGYKSVSQFSREFKRYYQFTPLQDKSSEIA